MHDWILFLTLIVTALSLAAAGMVCRCCRKTEREKDRRIVQALREQEQLAHEIERVRIQKETLEEVLGTPSREGAEPPQKQEETWNSMNS